MKTLRVFFGMMLGIALLGALFVGGYRAIEFSAGLFARMDVQVAAVTAITVVIALLAAMIIASSIQRASQQHKTNQFHAEKAATYQFFIDVWVARLQPGRMPDDGNPYPFSEERQALDRLLALYGSTSVVKAHTALRELVQESGAQTPQVRTQFAKALLEIRKDLGAETQDLTAELLQQLLFADAEKKHIAPKASAYQDRQPRVSLGANT